MTYNYAVYRGPLLMKRTLTYAKAEKIAKQLGVGARVVEQVYIGGN